MSFLRIRRENPEAVAVVFEDEQLTYGELNPRTSRLARYSETGCWA